MSYMQINLSGYSNGLTPFEKMEHEKKTTEELLEDEGSMELIMELRLRGYGPSEVYDAMEGLMKWDEDGK